MDNLYVVEYNNGYCLSFLQENMQKARCVAEEFAGSKIPVYVKAIHERTTENPKFELVFNKKSG